MAEGEKALATAALFASLACLEALARQGFLAPQNIDTIYTEMLNAARHASPKSAEYLEARLQEPFAAMRQAAVERWQG